MRDAASWPAAPDSRLRRAAGFGRRHWLEALAAVSLVGLVVAVNPVRVAGVLGHVRPQVLVLMAPVVLGLHTLRGLAWWVSLRHVGVDIGPFRSVYIMYAGQTLIFVPTGDLARVALVRRTGASGRDEGTIAGTIVFQELVYLVLIDMGVLPRVLLHPDVALLFLAMTAAHAAVFVVILWGPAYYGAVRLVTRVRPARRFDPWLRRMRPAFLAMMRPWNVAAALLLNGVAAGLLFTLFYLALQAVGVTTVPFTDATFAYGLGHLLSGLTFLPAGIGSQEAIVTGVLGAAGVAVSAATAAALLNRAFANGLMALVGLASGLLVRRAARREAREKA